ncbi:MAG: phospholipid carrier-dependent glycosyltransferase [Nitrospirae bacterium YQR-1]
MHYSWLSLLYVVAGAALCRHLTDDKENSQSGTRWRRQAGAYYIYLLISAFLLRSVLAVLVEGFPNDIACFKGWAIHSAEVGISEFYSGGVFADYPPGYIYILYIIGKISALFSLKYDSTAFLYLVKFPQIVSDIVLTHIVYVVSKKYLPFRASFALAFLYAFNPAVIINSAPWGQVDSFYTLTVVIFILFIIQQRLKPASLALAFAVLVKPQAIMFIPVWFFAHLYQAAFNSPTPPAFSHAPYRTKKFACTTCSLPPVLASESNLVLSKVDRVKSLIVNAAYAFIFFFLLVTPFAVHKEPLWIVHHYIKTLSSYPYATSNAFNLFALTGGNFADVTGRFFIFTYNTWGLFFIFLAVVFTFFVCARRRDTAAVVFTAFLLVSAAYVTGPKMHERYLFPALVLALFSYIFLKDKRVLFVFYGFSVTLFINEAYVLDYGIREIFFIPKHDPVLLIVSLANVLLLLFLVKIGYELIKIKTGVETSAYQRQPIPVEKQYTGFKKKDYILSGILVLFNTVLLLYNLGTNISPQTCWIPKGNGEGVTFDFGAEKELMKTCFFTGLGEGKYRLDYSNDHKMWENVADTELKTVFTWRCEETRLKARFMRLTVAGPGAMLYETAFINSGSGAIIPIKTVTPFNANNESTGTAQNLVDEQDRVPVHPSYLNSTYFDEIYHARTAYEHIHGINYYETTHPPLGKLFISLGIMIFGMNPFGWRIAGALFGIATIFVFYAFGLRLFRDSKYAFIAAFLMSFDFMHFAMSRIATIDVYAVFFIILMYYFMYIYLSKSFYTDRFKDVTVPLFLTGLSFALGVSVKWICVYAGLGLAVLFFYSLYLRYRESGLSVKNGVDFKTLTVKTAVFAAVFFVVVPIIIYTLSYLPVKSEGRTWPATAILNQRDMYEYHKNLEATHPFSSQWYLWPLMVRPLWAWAGGDYLAKNEAASIVVMGNPAIWWLSIPAFIAMLVMAYKKRRFSSIGVCVVTVGFLAQYLPWVLVPRLTFIYHFYASIVFLILSLTYVIMWMEEEHHYKFKRFTYSYLSLVLLLFVMFYPVLSGLTVKKTHIVTWLRWFESWVFF